MKLAAAFAVPLLAAVPASDASAVEDKVAIPSQYPDYAAAREAQYAAELERAREAQASYPRHVVGYGPRFRVHAKPRPRIRAALH